MYGLRLRAPLNILEGPLSFQIVGRAMQRGHAPVRLAVIARVEFLQ